MVLFWNCTIQCSLDLTQFILTFIYYWLTFLSNILLVLNLILGTLNPLSPKLDENEISLYMISACLNIQVSRIKEVITDDGMSSYVDKFSLLVS